MKILLLAFSFLLVSVCSLPAQYQKQRSNDGFLLAYHLTYAFQLPAGDLAERFGENYNVGSGLQLVLPSNWILEVDGQYLFGQQVKQDVIATLRSPEGYIFASDGGDAEVELRQRGYWIGASLGKLIGLSSANRRSGILISAGAGLLEHRIRIQDEPQVLVPALRKEYKKGYDRLSNGLALKQFIGYQHFSLNRRINFFAGFEFMQGFTESRRDWNTDEMRREVGRRLDLLYGFRLGWILPFYLGDKGDTIYY